MVLPFAMFLLAAGGGLLSVLVSGGKETSDKPDGPPTVAGAPRTGDLAQPVAELIKRIPGDVRFLLATDDLGGILKDLEGGPAGKVMAAPSVAGFVGVLRREPPGAMSAVFQAYELVRELLPHSAGPAALVLRERPEDRGPSLGCLMQLRPGTAPQALAVAGGALVPVGVRLRGLDGRPGETLRTVAADGDEGVTIGLVGDWLVLSDCIGGCREILLAAADPSGKAQVRVADGLRTAGPGRLVGFCEAGELLPSGAAGIIGLKTADWMALAASPSGDGTWIERLTVAGEAAANGLGEVPADGNEEGVRRLLLEALPESTVMAISLNVQDGAQCWRAVRAIPWPEFAVLLARGANAGLARAAGLDFTNDVATAVRGEATAAWLLPRQGIYPQLLAGVGLKPGAAAKLSLDADLVLELPFFGSGDAQRDVYRGAAFYWLAGQMAVNPHAPSPAFCFAGDRLMVAASSVHLKELIAAQGGAGARRQWLTATEAARMSQGMFSVRIALDRCMPYLYGQLRWLGVDKLLGAGPSSTLPMAEEVSDHFKTLETVAGRCDEGVRFETRSPLPPAALAGLCLLLAR